MGHVQDQYSSHPSKAIQPYLSIVMAVVYRSEDHAFENPAGRPETHPMLFDIDSILLVIPLEFHITRNHIL